MECRQTANYDEKINSLINNRNLKDYSCFIGVKTIDNAKEFYCIEKFDRIISIGDGLWDLFTAKNLNLEFIGIGLANKKILEENGADLIFQDLTELEI